MDMDLMVFPLFFMFLSMFFQATDPRVDSDPTDMLFFDTSFALFRDEEECGPGVEQRETRCLQEICRAQSPKQYEAINFIHCRCV